MQVQKQKKQQRRSMNNVERVTQALAAAKQWLFQRKRAYQITFGRDVHKTVLRDLAEFCRAHENTFHPDPRVEARLDGRREVWLRIQQHLKLSEEELWELYRKDKPNV